jgi:hypothetical protein
MAGAESIELPFKVRFCIEGIPHHARQASTVCQLLPPSTLFESIDLHHRNDNDVQCCCVVVWTRDPVTIAKEAGLWLKEIQDRPSAAWHFIDANFGDARWPRTGLVRVLSYEAIIHIDQIVDFKPPTVMSVDWPVRHSFRSRLGFRDDWSR